MVMKTAVKKSTTLIVPAGEFKAKCLHLIDEVHGEAFDVIVTKRGKPMARLVPIEPEAKPFRSIIGRTPGVKIPTEAEWKKLKAALAAEWVDPVVKLERAQQPSSKTRPRSSERR